MTSSVVVELRRTVMTPRGRIFPPRRVEVLHLTSSGMNTDGEMEKEEFCRLQEFVATRFPRLQGQFIILRKDEAGELVLCNNQAELLKAIQQTSHDPLQLYVQELSNWQKENQNESKELRCSSCDVVIEGSRVKCLECEDFNLCHQCDVRNVHDHHVTVRAGRPRFFNFALPMFKEILPKLCKEVREKNCSQHLPRLEPREIREFWLNEKKQGKAAMNKEHPAFGKRKHFMQGQPFCMTQSCEDNQQEIHCNNCGDVIKGMRVKCLECNVNLCGQCDDKGIHDNHVMVRGERPRFFNHGLPTVGEIIPRLCEETQRKANGEFIPRLTQRDVIQYWRQQRTEGGEGENVFRRRRQRMRERWCRFLNGISTDQLMMADDDKNMEKKSEIATGPARAEGKEGHREIVGENMEQMRRQWMQRCQQQWRQQMNRSEDLDGDGMKYCQRIWQPYMRRCWNLWQEKQLGEDKEGHGRCTAEDKDENCHPRRQWMKNCWKLWCEEAAKNKNQWLTDDSAESEETEQQPGCHPKRMRRRGPFPGYHFLMMKSWKMMQEQSSSSADGRSDGSQIEADEKRNPVDEEYTIRPGVAKHMLKQCWVNGCRELWWMEARKLLNIEEGDGRQGVVGEKMTEPCQQDVLKAMNAEANWRAYMQQCWHLWKQMNKRAGFIPRTEAVEDKSPGVREHPKGKWMKACWPMWLEEMAKESQAESEQCGRRHQVKWNKRPFAGWRPLIMRSWQMMQECLHESEKKSKDVQIKEVQCLKAAWMKEMQREMKRLSLQEKEKKGKDAGCDVRDEEGADDDTRSGDKFMELCKRMLKQYFEMWKEREENMKKEEGIECESPNMPPTSPVLRLTLSMKENK